jgi:prepilin-type N-terminal cleavage/methylation domain-containing protein
MIKNTKVGFTLIEMVLVVGIILILSAVLILGIGSYMSQADAVASDYSSEQSALSNKNSQINSKFVNLGY